MTIDLERYFHALERIDSMQSRGEVTGIAGLLIESRGPAAAIGDFCEIVTAGRPVRIQVVGFRSGRVLSMPLEQPEGVRLGDTVVARSEDARIAVGPGLLGRVLDGFGRPLDGKPLPAGACFYDLYRHPVSPMEREPIEEPLITGVRVVDGMLPCGYGQRMGIFGGSGVGKSTLLGTMCRENSADVSVVALIGERNREVREFLDRDLGEEGLKRSVVVVATSDRPAPLRVRAAFVATAIAEYFRDSGAKVLFVMDSVTRLAMAQREIGLAAGEPPGQKGYTASVFNLLPRIFERAGNFRGGSITGFFTVLVEGDDFQEPVCDAVRGMLDGHIILSRQLGAAGYYPAVDVLNSISRLESSIASPEQKEDARKIRQAMAIYQQSEDLINLGAYVSGSNPPLDSSIRLRPEILGFLRQDSEYKAKLEQTQQGMRNLAAKLV